MLLQLCGTCSSSRWTRRILGVEPPSGGQNRLLENYARRAPMRIRSRLVLLVSAVLIPALVGAGIALAYIYREEQAFNHQSLRETARALALALDRDMGRREAMLKTLAESPSLERRELERFYGYASAVAKQSDSAITLSDLEGRQLLNTRLAFNAPLPRMLPAERAFRARFGNEATLMSDVYTPPAGLGPHSFAIQ